MGEWLEAQGVDEPWELAPALVAFGWKPDTLNELAADLTREQAALLVQWLATSHSSDLLTSELRTSANRISELVQVAKRYAAVDQAPIQRVDVHTGLDDALVILGHKLGPGLNLRREYGAGLPEIEAHGAELNQVWTNLIDNAIAVMPDGGDLTIRTDAHGRSRDRGRDRHRPGHPTRDTGANVRTLLHDQTTRPRDGPGPIHGRSRGGAAPGRNPGNVNAWQNRVPHRASDGSGTPP